MKKYCVKCLRLGHKRYCRPSLLWDTSSWGEHSNSLFQVKVHVAKNCSLLPTARWVTHLKRVETSTPVKPSDAAALTDTHETLLSTQLSCKLLNSWLRNDKIIKACCFKLLSFVFSKIGHHISFLVKSLLY